MLKYLADLVLVIHRGGRDKTKKIGIFFKGLSELLQYMNIIKEKGPW